MSRFNIGGGVPQKRFTRLLRQQQRCIRLMLAITTTVVWCAGGDHIALSEAHAIGVWHQQEEQSTPTAKLKSLMLEWWSLDSLPDQDLELVCSLIREGADVSARTETGTTPIYAAAGGGHLEIVRVLLKAGAATNGNEEGDFAPLNVAAMAGHLEIVKLLVFAGASLDSTNSNGSTAVLDAAEVGQKDIVSYLVGVGADVRIVDNSGLSVLCVVAGRDSPSLIYSLLQHGASIDGTDNIGFTALMFAAGRGANENVRALLLAGADINKQIPDISEHHANVSAIWLASYWGETETIRILANNGARLNFKARNQQTPLLAAISEDHAEAARILLDAGANVELQGGFNHTPLNDATRNRHPAIVRLLIEYGADVNARPRHGQTALEIAVENEDSEIVRLLFQSGATFPSVVRPGLLCFASQQDTTNVLALLLQYSPDDGGADLKYALEIAAKRGHSEAVTLLIDRYPEVDGEDALWAAVLDSNIESVRLLLAAGANAGFIHSSGMTPAYIASRNGSAECVQMLIDHGATVVKAVAPHGETPLYAASRVGAVEVVQLLLASGAKPNIQCSDAGETALTQAIDKRHTRIVALLKAAGAKAGPANGDRKPRRQMENVHYYAIDEKVAPLIEAVLEGDEATVTRILESDANIDIATADGKTALWIASELGLVDIVQMILDSGKVDVNQPTNQGATPLLIASVEGHPLVVQSLIGAGADVNFMVIQNGFELTPLTAAQLNNHDWVARILLENGAIP